MKWLLYPKQYIRTIRAMRPYAKKYGFRYYLSKRFRRTVKSREQRRKRGSGFLVSLKYKRKVLLERDGNLCQWCFQPLNGDIEIDHIREVANGGTNKLKNLRLLHHDCHVTRHRGENFNKAS